MHAFMCSIEMTWGSPENAGVTFPEFILYLRLFWQLAGAGLTATQVILSRHGADLSQREARYLVKEIIPSLWGKLTPSPNSSKWGSNSTAGWSVTMSQPWRVTAVGVSWGWKDWVEAQKKSGLWTIRVSVKLCPNSIGTLSEQIGRWGYQVQASLGWFLWKKKAKEA